MNDLHDRTEWFVLSGLYSQCSRISKHCQHPGHTDMEKAKKFLKVREGPPEAPGESMTEPAALIENNDD